MKKFNLRSLIFMILFTSVTILLATIVTVTQANNHTAIQNMES